MTTIEQHSPSSLPPIQDAPLTITLSAAEARLVRTALQLLRDTYTRHNGMHPLIHTILERLPAPDIR